MRIIGETRSAVKKIQQKQPREIVHLDKPTLQKQSIVKTPFQYSAVFGAGARSCGNLEQARDQFDRPAYALISSNKGYLSFYLVVIIFLRDVLDHSEKLADEYLRHLGFHDITYEPDGNVPPDFLVDKKIAVEVRQLNQNQFTDSGYCSLEEVSIPLSMKFKNFLASLGSADTRESWFVRYRFKRPLPPWNQLQATVRKRLTAFRDNQRPRHRVNIIIDEDFELDLIPASDAQPTFFVFGGYSDSDSGGWVFSETQKNLRICIEEKTRKIARVRNKYQEWWLILIDYIGYGVDDCDRKLYREHLGIDHNWDKIILVNPLNPCSAFEL